MSQLKNIVITGCNQGIGYALLNNLASLSSYNIIMACRNLQKAHQAKQSILKAHPDAQLSVEELDLLSQSSIKSFIDKISNNSIDILVNNAGIACPMNSTDYQIAKKVFSTNFYGPIQLTEQLLPSMPKNGRILFSGGYIGKFSQIKNQQYKQKLKKDGLSKDELFGLMSEYLEKVKDQSFGKDGLPKWFYTISKIGINVYPQILKNHNMVLEKDITTYSYCPGWTKTQMTGNKGKQTTQQAVVTPMFLVQLKHEQCRKEEQGGFFEQCTISNLN